MIVCCCIHYYIFGALNCHVRAFERSQCPGFCDTHDPLHGTQSHSVLACQVADIDHYMVLFCSAPVYVYIVLAQLVTLDS